eukprot:Cvel_33932.t1-p1 / transcript=Cvel_33932.t1 / gene=Cvel_33932 / organism=Chromera_velia_CCMP2878 / gene_product=Zinc finger protein 283, putative / transcript_product=Zinc finger protein 283, putative / location=Cvel_scaffold5665:3194-4575(+) / protein_length=211 / sequence_SO=supercontig / SO=protein_coding / is_pseudo=false
MESDDTSANTVGEEVSACMDGSATAARSAGEHKCAYMGVSVPIARSVGGKGFVNMVGGVITARSVGGVLSAFMVGSNMLASIVGAVPFVNMVVLVVDVETAEGVGFANTVVNAPSAKSAGVVASASMDGTKADATFSINATLRTPTVNEKKGLERGVFGERLENGPMRDTVYIPIGYNVTVAFDATHAGEWLLHCHIDFHLLNGMATSLRS